MSAKIINLADWIKDHQPKPTCTYTGTLMIAGVNFKEVSRLTAHQAAEFAITEGQMLLLRFSEIHPNMVEYTAVSNGVMYHHYLNNSLPTADVVATIKVAVDQ